MTKRFPRSRGGPRRGPRHDRKTLQLCQQVGRTLSYVLSGECDDDLLRDLVVESVTPCPDASRLMVHVRPLTLANQVDPVAILARLAAHHERLRFEVANSITRRKAPELAFQVITEGPPP